MKFLKYSAVTMMVMIIATFGVMAANNGSVSDSADFTIGNAYNISVYNSTSLEFTGDDAAVGNVDSTGSFETTKLEIYLEHNYDVNVTGSVSAFVLDNSTSDYSADYAIPAEWLFEWADVSYPEGEGDWSPQEPLAISVTDSTLEDSIAARMDDTEGDAYGRISVKATRGGLDDPQGEYTASLDVTVSDLS